MTSNAGEVKVNRKMPSDDGNDKLYYPDDCVGAVHMKKQMRQLGLEGKPEALCDYYNSISQQYDKYNDIIGKDVGAGNITKIVENAQPNRESRILDAACGSGITGVKLKELGYQNIDGLDFSQGMLDQCQSKKIYKNYICASITPEKNDNIADGTYDVILMHGGIAHGHVSLDAIPELVRMAKSGGAVIFNITAYYVKHFAEYSEEAIESRLQQLVSDGRLAKWTNKYESFASSEAKAYFYILTVA